MLKLISILLLAFSFSFCNFLPEKEERPPENPYRAEMLKKLREKIECEGCNPTKEELVLFYFLKNDLKVEHTQLSNGNPWQNYFNTYFLYFPRDLRNPWYTQGAIGNINGGRAPGVYYPPYGFYGNSARYHHTAGRYR
ncbi:MAG: hypothetical protein IPL26_17205 [Leptospiraceae bacterium]|nr:hypothetical protein [Leptospiraceae bacterium]